MSRAPRPPPRLCARGHRPPSGPCTRLRQICGGARRSRGRRRPGASAAPTRTGAGHRPTGCAGPAPGGTLPALARRVTRPGVRRSTRRTQHPPRQDAAHGCDSHEAQTAELVSPSPPGESHRGRAGRPSVAGELRVGALRVRAGSAAPGGRAPRGGRPGRPGDRLCTWCRASHPRHYHRLGPDINRVPRRQALNLRKTKEGASRRASARMVDPPALDSGLQGGDKFCGLKPQVVVLCSSCRKCVTPWGASLHWECSAASLAPPVRCQCCLPCQGVTIETCPDIAKCPGGKAAPGWGPPGREESRLPARAPSFKAWASPPPPGQVEPSAGPPLSVKSPLS